MNSKTLIHALLITAAFAVVGFYGYREIKSILVLQKMDLEEKALAGPVAPSVPADLQPEPEVRPKALPRRRERVKREVERDSDQESDSLQAASARSSKSRRDRGEHGGLPSEVGRTREVTEQRRIWGSGEVEPSKPKAVTAKDANEALETARNIKDNVQGLLGF